MKDKEYLDRFEDKLQNELLRLCTSYKMLNGVLLTTEDITDKWDEFAPEYLADAVEQVNEYPTVSVAWAAYLGMGVAYSWDIDWDTFKAAKYQSFYGQQGFDDMDEYIVKDILCISLESDEAKQIETMIRACAKASIAHIRNEQIEPQSQLAYHIFARTVKVMFKIGASIELKLLGYKFEKTNLGDC